MMDGCHPKNQQIAMSHDDAKRVSQAYQPSAIFDFKMKFSNGWRT